MHPLDLDAAASAQRTRLLQRRRREIQGRVPRAAPRNGDRVKPDVALRVQDVAAAQIANRLRDGGLFGAPRSTRPAAKPSLS
ncbi:MAG TPA: hypothetical protein VNA28_17030 [Solirubrobacteraceae bacterium]|nr:hypothetical protein [Solirubrobacteraceae bacterium]